VRAFANTGIKRTHCTLRDNQNAQLTARTSEFSWGGKISELEVSVVFLSGSLLLQSIDFMLPNRQKSS